MLAKDAVDAVIALVAHEDVPVKLAPTIVSVDGLYVNAFRPSINMVLELPLLFTNKKE